MAWTLSPFDPTEDWSLFDGVETITYDRYDPEDHSYSTLFTGLSALVREVDQVNTSVVEGETTLEQLVFHLPVAEMIDDGDTITPHRLDRITRSMEQSDETNDGPTLYYYVQEVRRSTLGTRYRVTTTKGP